MNETLKELVTLDSKLETLFNRALTLAAAENGGGAAVELWLQARLRAAIAFDEHARMLRERSETPSTTAASPVEELREIAAHRPASERKSTFTKVEIGEEVRALSAINAQREARSRKNRDDE